MKTNPIKFFWPVLKPYKWWCLLMLQAPITSAFHPVLYNYSVKLLIDLFVEHDVVQYGQALQPIFYFLGAYVINELGWRLHNFAAWRCVPYIDRNVMCRTYNSLLGHSYTFFAGHLSGTLISKVKGICAGFYSIYNSITSGFAATIAKVVVSGFCLLFASFDIFLAVMAFFLTFVPFCYICFAKLYRAQEQCAQFYHNIMGRAADSITNIFTLFAFASTQREVKRLQDEYSTGFMPLKLRFYKLDFWICLVASLMYLGMLGGIFILLVKLKNAGRITVGDIAFIISMTYVFADNLWHFIFEIMQIIKSYVDFEAAFSIIAQPHHSLDKVGANDLCVTKGAIDFKNVLFEYEDGKSVFSRLNLSVSSGQKVGLVGHSGAGKSTLISLLLKNFAVTGGDIVIDGQSISDVTSDSLRSQISLIPQDIMLFHRSIGENIGYAKVGATQADIEHAARMANIHEFIAELPEGYDTLVGERGLKLSGGQRQRIAIARAILKNAPILILDEATSSLDVETEGRVQQSINKMLETNHATIIAVAHRLSTVRHMDRIVVMDEGLIVEDGSFEQLMNKKRGRFRALWNHQMNGMIV